MITINITNLGEIFDPETGHGCDGGYGIPETNEIFIDERLSPEKKIEVAIHEVVHLYCKGRIRHTKMNDMVKDIIEVYNSLK